ncbi:Metallo-dependent phosphatase-like protein [Peziza echinospora]|nr:Metallo-dependent phosphatase-like protein [Peziza echinospora]
MATSTSATTTTATTSATENSDWTKRGTSVTFKSANEGSAAPALRILHYNDVYHVSPGSQEPIGGASRFVAAINHYRSSPEYSTQPPLLTFFSGDAFNPSLESSVTKGSHMVPILNKAGTDAACLGNHDLDFGAEQFRHLAGQCGFPWLCANVKDMGRGGLIAGLNGWVVLEKGGVKVGVLGLVEKEWLDTLNSLPPNLKFVDPAEAAKEIVPKLRAEGAEFIIVLSHQREPNDVKFLANIPEGLVDIVLGGHDHYYAHQVVNGAHLIRSGSDFKQVSYIEVRRKTDESAKGWDIDIIRRDIMREIPEDQETAIIVENLSSALQAKLDKPIGHSSVPLDARFTTVRLKESNLGNFVCDLMRYYYSTDCTIMAAGTFRGDRVYEAGVVKCLDVLECFPFEDPVVVIRVSGAQIWAALENAVSKVPALEGRFPQVSNIEFTYDPDQPEGSRVLSVKLGGEVLDLERRYKMSTRGYMFRGKDGFTSLTAEAGAEELVDEENGLLITQIIRQYFMSLKVIGKWNRGGIFRQFFGGFKRIMSGRGELGANPSGFDSTLDLDKEMEEDTEHQDGHTDDESEDEGTYVQSVVELEQERHRELVENMAKKWMRFAKLKHAVHGVDWTRSISPKVEGRITIVKKGEV